MPQPSMDAVTEKRQPQSTRDVQGNRPKIGPREPGLFEIIAITKALADESRVRLIAALEGRELCVCQLIELIGLAPSTVSKHLSILKSARLIQSRKDGRWIYYRLADDRGSNAARTALNWLIGALEGRQTILDDRRRLDRMMQTMPSDLCK
jgi:ArsR family transcriptional regulator, arsenate/arsenite/antimonite-responsive transcriptional repressor